jgi:hypothetical protein
VERVARRSPAPILLLGPRHRSYGRLLALLESAGPGSAALYELARVLIGDAVAEFDIVHPVSPDIERRMRNRGAPRHATLTARRWLRATRVKELRSWLDAASTWQRPRTRVVSDGSADAMEALAQRAEPDLLVVCADRRWLRGFVRATLAGRVIEAAVGSDVLLGRYTTKTASARTSRSAAA